MVMEPMAAEDLEDLLTQAARARRLAGAIPNDPIGLRLAQVADELDAEIDRQTRIITSSEGIPASDVPKASAPQSPVQSDRGRRDRHIAGSERKRSPSAPMSNVRKPEPPQERSSHRVPIRLVSLAFQSKV
jgi:hypothetical protein